MSQQKKPVITVEMLKVLMFPNPPVIKNYYIN